MKKIVFFVLIFVTVLIACQKEVEISKFETIEFKNARLESGGLLTIVDTPRQIMQYTDHGGMIDTLGETKVFLHSDLWINRDWATTYMSSKHSKTMIYYAFKDHVVVALVASDVPFFDRLYIYNDGVKKEFPFYMVAIIKTEIDLDNKVLRITHNDSWTRTGPIPNETNEFKY